MAAVQYPPIDQLLPHRAPMILIDRMIDATDAGSRCEVTIVPQTLFIEPGGVPAFEPLVRYHKFGDSSVDFTVTLRAKEFTDQDLSENWLMIKQHERHMRLQGRL